MLFRTKLKLAAQSLLPSRWPPVVVASMGRSGSTLLFDAVRHGQAQERFHSEGVTALRLVTSEAWHPQATAFHPGVVYKTHAIASEMPAAFRGRAIFVFGRPSEAALSIIRCRDVYGQAWIDAHFAHLDASGNFDDVVKSDVMGFENQIQSWMDWEGHASLMMIRYEHLWENQPALEAFLGFPVNLPPKRSRRSGERVDPATCAAVLKTYGALDAWVDTLPNCVVLK